IWDTNVYLSIPRNCSPWSRKRSRKIGAGHEPHGAGEGSARPRSASRPPTPPRMQGGREVTFGFGVDGCRSSARLQVDEAHAQLGVKRLGDLVQRRKARRDGPTLEPSDRRLRRTHPLRQLALTQPTRLAQCADLHRQPDRPTRLLISTATLRAL